MSKNKRFTLIIGKAGCGKTEALAKMIIEKMNEKLFHSCSKSPLELCVLAPTHSAVNNIKNRVMRLSHSFKASDEIFQTIHSFFRINYETNLVLGPVHDVDYIFIDEFFMLSKTLFSQIIHKTNAKFILCGDPLQLGPPINMDDVITFNNLKEFETDDDSGRSLLNVSTDYISKLCSMPYDIIKNDIDKCIVLKHNYRSNDLVMDALESIRVCSAEDNLIYMDTYDDIIRYLVNNPKCVLLGSKYSILQRVYDQWADYDSRFKFHLRSNCKSGAYFKQLHLYEGMPLIITETTNDYYNGQRVIFKSLDINNGNVLITVQDKDKDIIMRLDKGEMKNKFFPLAPYQFMTIHKAQGMGFDEVIIICDELFQLGMLYTAITRARHKVMFYISEKSPSGVEQSKSSFPKMKTLNELFDKNDDLFRLSLKFGLEY